MADHIALNSGGGGDTAWADDCGAAKVQGVKLVAGGNAVAQMGATNYTYLSAASANQDAQHPSAAAGVLYGMTVTNSNTSPRYIKLYNKASGCVYTDTVWRRYMIPAGGGIREQFPMGVAFDTGLGFRLTTLAANDDQNAVAAGEICVNFELA